MHAAQVTSWAESPSYTTVPDLPEPPADQLRLRVLATAIHRLVRSRAAGTHYTSKSLPHLPGVDGVGQDDATGKKYYFFALATGSFAEFVNVPKAAVWELPAAATDPATVAALVNPTMSSWMALATRTSGLKDGFSVAVLGVTSASGRIAVRAARARGAGRVVGIARNAAAMAELGLDEAVVLGPDTDWAKVGPVDVVLDYVGGDAATNLLQALPPSANEVQFVQIGTVSGEDSMTVPGALLRSKKLALRGAGPGSWSIPEFSAEVPAMLKLVATIKRGDDIVVKKLEEIEKVWDDKSLGSKRVVFTF